jgi:acyl-coenzyme A synthetase/AMP-(fatty) acid ligase/acyl carrier protein
MLKREELVEVDRIREIIVRHGVNHFICVPPLYSAILEALSAEELSSLKTVTLAGDTLSAHLMEASLGKNENLEIVNEYGITECSVMSTIYRHQERDSIIKIGHPVSNTQLYILDEQQRPLPIGVAGELHIAGTGLARGYLNNPELTNEKFLGVQNPFFKKGFGRRRLYRTGDLARWLADGAVEFLGRMTYQVKVRGFRIEMEEIEARLLGHKFVKEAVVVDRGKENGETYLCAYMTLLEEAGGEIGVDELKSHLSRFLPGYMIPVHFMFLESLPLTAHGKIDRKALPVPQVGGEGEQKAVLPPGNRTQEQLLDIWSEVLGIDRSAISVDANFFDLGGHSLSLVKMNVNIKETFEKNIPVASLFRLTTIELLAAYLDEEEINLQVSDEILDESVNTMDETLSLLMEDD